MDTMSIDQFSSTVADLMATMKEIRSVPTPIIGYEAIMRRHEAMSTLRTRLDTLYDLVFDMDLYREVAPVLRQLERRFDQLPDAPSIIAVMRAQNLLLFHPCMLVIEETRQNKLATPEIKHIVLINEHGDILFDHAFVPSSQQAEPFEDAPLTAQPSEDTALQPIWFELFQALAGRFILTNDLAHAQHLLEESINVGSPLPILIGDSFIRLVMEYLGLDWLAGKPGDIDNPLVETVLYEQVGLSPEEANPYTALEQAKRMLSTLQEMAAGTLPLPDLPE